MHQAINKYGKENFKVSLIKECNSQDELDLMEIFYISKCREIIGDDNCYNISAGGLTVRSWNKGKRGIYTEETINKMANARRKAMSDATKRKQISDSLKGKPLSEERKRRISEATKAAMQRPEVKSKLKRKEANYE